MIYYMREGTFVIFDFPSLAIRVVFLPIHVLRDGEKRELFLSLGALHDGCDELLQKSINFEQGGPEVMQEIDEQAFDVTAIVILIGHNHQMAITKGTCIVVFFAEGQPNKSSSISQEDRVREGGRG